MGRLIGMGDRVICTREYCDNSKIVGVTGTVVWVSGGGFAVEFDEEIGGHDCGGLAETGHGWWLDEHCVELLNENNNTESQREDFEEMTYEELMG